MQIITFFVMVVCWLRLWKIVLGRYCDYASLHSWRITVVSIVDFRFSAQDKGVTPTDKSHARHKISLRDETRQRGTEVITANQRDVGTNSGEENKPAAAK